MPEMEISTVGQPHTGAIPWESRGDIPEWQRDLVREQLAGLKGDEKRARMIQLQDELKELRELANENRQASSRKIHQKEVVRAANTNFEC